MNGTRRTGLLLALLTAVISGIAIVQRETPVLFSSFVAS